MTTWKYGKYFHSTRSPLIPAFRNGGNPSSPLIGKYCGTDIPQGIWSHTNQLYLFFKSDVSQAKTGFEIFWSSTATGTSPHTITALELSSRFRLWRHIIFNNGIDYIATLSRTLQQKRRMLLADFSQQWVPCASSLCRP